MQDALCPTKRPDEKRMSANVSTLIQGGPSGRGQPFVDIAISCGTRRFYTTAKRLIWCQQTVFRDQMYRPVDLLDYSWNFPSDDCRAERVIRLFVAHRENFMLRLQILLISAIFSLSGCMNSASRLSLGTGFIQPLGEKCVLQRCIHFYHSNINLRICYYINFISAAPKLRCVRYTQTVDAAVDHQNVMLLR